MLNRKILALVLPAVAVSALVGSGFSAWYFYDTGSYSTKDVNVNVDIAQEFNETIGTLSMKSATTPNKVLLDQGGYENKADPTKGIQFLNNDTVVENIEVGFTFTNETVYENLKKAGLAVTVTRQILVADALLDYVKVVPNIDDVSKTKEEIDYTVYTTNTELISSDAHTDTITLMDGATANSNSTFLNYIVNDDDTTKKPQDDTQYQAMVTALREIGGNEAIIFRWSAKVAQATQS